MKTIIILLLVFISFKCLMAQKVNIIADDGDGPTTVVIKNGKNFEISSNLKELKSFILKSDDLDKDHTLEVEAAGVALTGASAKTYNTKGQEVQFEFESNIINKQISIIQKNKDGNKMNTIVFKFIQTISVEEEINSTQKSESEIMPFRNILKVIEQHFEETRMGLKERGKNDNIVHIFLDEHGNNLLSTIPQGIANSQYKVHIIYKGFSDMPDDVSYSISQKTGSFSSSLAFNNTGILGKLTNFQSEGEKGYDVWRMKSFLLSTSTEDISFDVIVSTKDDKKKPVIVVLNSYTIKMIPVYHGTFDVGLINSKLNNRSFELVQSPHNTTDKIIKETNRPSQGIVTIMATFYTSPVVLIRRKLSKSYRERTPAYKLTGRNFLDDHDFFERIYPTIGVSVSSKTFENLFFGANWEIARGISLFGGGHWGKVNTFELPNYASGVTVVTQSEFDYYINKKWKLDWAYGLKLDILIITNLFK